MGSIFGIASERSGGVRPTRRARTWNDNGMQYTQEESSYIAPNLGFVTMSRTSGAPFVQLGSSRASHNRAGSLLGKVVNGIADYVNSNSHHTGGSVGHRQRRKQHAGNSTFPLENERNSARPRPHSSGITASRSETQSSRQRPQRHETGQHSASPHRQSQRVGHRPGQSGRPAFTEDYVDNGESDADDWREDERTHAAAEHAGHAEALKNAAEFHRKEAKSARRQLEQACRQPTGNSFHLQDLAQKIDIHEIARENALRDLDQAQVDAARLQHDQRTRRRSRPKRRERSKTDSEDGVFFNDPFFDSFFDFPRQQRFIHPAFVEQSGSNFSPHFGALPFAAFEGFFADFDRVHRMHNDIHQQFFGTPGSNFTASFGTRPQTRRFSSAPDNRSQRPQRADCTTFNPQPAANLMKPAEAQQLFRAYDERWNAVSPTDPNVPFPARGLKPTSLSARNTLWAPSVNSPIESWSEETVMKANTQAFFLGAVGMRPAYTESPGAKIELSVDKASATPAQAKQLLEILKKERIRWHSDRLGKRNGGRPGPNEALQRDERARAVYHGVCELIEAAQ